MAEIGPTRVVVAEDDETILELVRAHLEAAGYAVYPAADGEAALNVIQSIRPAAVVLDLSMSKLDGFGVLLALRDRYSGALPPVMVLTARHATEDVRRCLALGAKDFLAKPFNKRDLLARVARLVRRPSVSRQRYDTAVVWSGG